MHDRGALAHAVPLSDEEVKSNVIQSSVFSGISGKGGL